MKRIAAFAAAACCAAQLISSHPPALASTARLSGVVVAGSNPVGNAKVSVSGNNMSESTTTNSNGRFAFSDLTPGSYIVSATATAGSGATTIDLSASGADIQLAVSQRSLGLVTVTAPPPVRKSGTDVTLNQAALRRSPAAGSFSELLIQLPGAARGANGVVHINGDHGDIDYVVDGVSIPQELNRNIGGEFNPNDISFVDVLEGAYPAQYGERFASVLNINTRAASGSSGFTGEALAGSFGHLDTTLGFQGTEGRGSLVTAFRNETTQRGLDPPNPSSPHNTASDANQFVRYTVPHGNDYINFTVSHAYRTFQIPLDLFGGQPPSSDDNETQDDLFTAIEMRHAVGDRGSLSYGFGYKRSRIRDFGDPGNDWTYGERLWQAAGGSPDDCNRALTISNYTNGTCGYSLYSDRTAIDYTFNLDNALESGVHEVSWGGVYDAAHVGKTYDVTLQPNNFLAPIYSPTTPAAPFSVVDNAPNVGHTEAVYVQDAWRMGQLYELDYGVRADAFAVQSIQFDRGFAMLGPRIKVARFYGPRSSLYAYYGRFFTPFSLENVSPSAAQLLNLPLQRTVAAFDLKPQRDSNYEIGGHLPVGVGDLGLRVMQKNATDLIDDTQVGVTLLHQDINYRAGRIATQSLYYQLPLDRQSRVYFSANHTYSVNRGCETQLLAPCFGSPLDWTPADHEQRWGSTTGVVSNDARGGWFSIDGEYGSGLSSAACPPGTPGFCKYTPHVTFDVEKGFALGASTKMLVRVRNLLDHEYYITYLNAQGNHYESRRAFDLGFDFGER
jgi:Carboxypeptidase regulatory-like domain/TonB-dependent Receptor Plug Domain